MSGTGCCGLGGAGRESNITGTVVEYAQGGGKQDCTRDYACQYVGYVGTCGTNTLVGTCGIDNNTCGSPLPYGSGGGGFTYGQQGAVIIKYVVLQETAEETALFT